MTFSMAARVELTDLTDDMIAENDSIRFARCRPLRYKVV